MTGQVQGIVPLKIHCIQISSLGNEELARLGATTESSVVQGGTSFVVDEGDHPVVREVQGLVFVLQKHFHDLDVTLGRSHRKRHHDLVWKG